MSRYGSTGNPLERPVNEAVDFAVHSANTLIKLLPEGKDFLLNKTILEIGAGQDLGLPLILTGLGTKTVVADKYLCKWDEAFHPSLYRRLREVMVEQFPGISTTAINEVIDSESHIAAGMTILDVGLENVHELPDRSIDIHYSNATFEHLSAVEDAITELARITKNGGLGFHQIDFRDHRNFDRPLEYLTIPDEEFSALLESVSWSCGNRIRPTEFQEMFERSGFIVRFEPNLFVEENYLYEVRPRLQKHFVSLPIDALRVLGGRFFLTKK